MTTELIYPVDGCTVSLESSRQGAFFNEETEQGTYDLGVIIQSENSPVFNHSYPLPITFRWKSGCCDNRLYVSDNSDLSGADVYETNAEEAEVYNLKTGHRYFWRVNCSEIHTFCTELTFPRYIKADGVNNIRDLGSYVLPDGRKLRQGLLYRGPSLETVTEKGADMLNRLLIKTELDLRLESIGKNSCSVLGQQVNYVQLPCLGYDDFINEDGRQNAKAIFEFLADDANYPVYFHCAGGADRTGTLAFLLGAVIGIDENTLLKDYELTMLAGKDEEGPDMRRTRWGELFCRFSDELSKPEYGAGDLCLKSLKALELCGISAETLNSIRKIMIEE